MVANIALRWGAAVQPPSGVHCHGGGTSGFRRLLVCGWRLPKTFAAYDGLRWILGIARVGLRESAEQEA